MTEKVPDNHEFCTQCARSGACCSIDFMCCCNSVGTADRRHVQRISDVVLPVLTKFFPRD